MTDGFGGRRAVLLGKHDTPESRAEYLRVLREWEAAGRRTPPTRQNGQLKTAHHGHERLVLIGPRAQEILRPYLGTKLDAYRFSPAESERRRSEARREARRTPLTPSQRARRPKARRHTLKGKPQIGTNALDLYFANLGAGDTIDAGPIDRVVAIS